MIFRIIASLFLLFCNMISFLHADSYSGSSTEEAVIIRVPVWVFLETQPGTMEQDIKKLQIPPRQALTDLSATVLEGMTYGWQFAYIPFDKKRNVTEEFTLTPIQTIVPNDNRLHITELRPQYPYLYCWAEYRITSETALRRREWQRSHSVTSKGYGYGLRKEEIHGVRQAYREAALNAVRNYLQKNEKNKPKYVSGEMLIKDNPRLSASSGKFTVELTVYLYIKELVPYTVF